MSLDSCKTCGHIVDTDFDCMAYDLGACMCSSCRDAAVTCAPPPRLMDVVNAAMISIVCMVCFCIKTGVF